MVSNNRKRRIVRFADILLLLLSSTIGFMLVEVGYRTYLYKTQPDRFSPVLVKEHDLKFWYMQHSPYKYSEEFGYEYIPGTFNGGSIHNGTVQDCYDALWVVNERGNVGRIDGSYDHAELKILVFGDSWTTANNGLDMPWPKFLQSILAERLDRSVHVVNFGRESYGILQMFDLAAARIPKWKPDLAVIAFITDDLSRDRFWRNRAMLNGYERLMGSVTPGNLDVDTASDLYIVNSKATTPWCRKLLVSQEKADPALRELEAIAMEVQRRSTLRANVLSLSQSFVLDAVLHREPFYRTLKAARPSQWPHHQMKDFAEDARMIANIRALEKTGIPYVLIHLAFYPELKTGQEYVHHKNLARHMALAESLKRVTGKLIYETIEHANIPVDDLESLSKDIPKDYHPSKRGAQFYAEVVTEVLRRHGYVY